MLWTCLSRASHRCVSHRVPRIGVHSMSVPLIRVSHERVSHGVFLISMHSMGVPPIGVPLLGMPSMGVPLVGVLLMGVSLMPSIRHILPSSLTPLTHPQYYR
jgi:hypothetical protein